MYRMNSLDTLESFLKFAGAYDCNMQSSTSSAVRPSNVVTPPVIAGNPPPPVSNVEQGTALTPNGNSTATTLKPATNPAKIKTTPPAVK